MATVRCSWPRLAAAVAVLLLASSASSARAATVDKCRWSAGVCEATPGALLAAQGATRPPSPMAENTLRAFALDAACLVRREERACRAVANQRGCEWDDGVCAVDPDWADAKIERAPASLAGCPGSLAAAVGVCKAAADAKTCSALGETCAWCVACMWRVCVCVCVCVCARTCMCVQPLAFARACRRSFCA